MAMGNEDLQVTTQEFAGLLDVEKEVAYGLMRFLVAKGMVKKLDGTLKAPGAKGKGADIFAMPATTGAAVARLLNAAYNTGRAK